MTAQIRGGDSLIGEVDGDRLGVMSPLKFQAGSLWSRVAESGKPVRKISSQAGLQTLIHRVGGPL